MKKEYVRSCIGITGAVLAFLVFAYCYLHPGQPEGTVDLIWPGELGSCTQEEIREELLGNYRTSINRQWGEPMAAYEQPDVDVYSFEGVPYLLILEYDGDGRVMDVEYVQQP